MKRVKILIISGALVAATAIAMGNNASQEKTADKLNVEVPKNSKNEHEKGTCWRSITVSTNPNKTVLYYVGNGECIRLPGKKTMFSRRGECCRILFPKK